MTFHVVGPLCPRCGTLQGWDQSTLLCARCYHQVALTGDLGLWRAHASQNHKGCRCVIEPVLTTKQITDLEDAELQAMAESREFTRFDAAKAIGQAYEANDHEFDKELNSWLAEPLSNKGEV